MSPSKPSARSRQPGSAAGAQRFADRVAELRAAWQRWQDAPSDEGAAAAFRAVVHRMAGLAQVQRRAPLALLARDLDASLARWSGAAEVDRIALASLFEACEATSTELLESLSESSGAAGAPAPHGVALRVLLVEDDAQQAAHWAEALRQRGIEVAIAHDFGALETEIASHRPDLLLIDYWLDAATTAADIALLLKRTPAAAQLPKVCLTVDAGPVPRQAAMQTGFAAVVRKSIGADELAGLLREVVRAAARG